MAAQFETDARIAELLQAQLDEEAHLAGREHAADAVLAARLHAQLNTKSNNTEEDERLARDIEAMDAQHGHHAAVIAQQHDDASLALALSLQGAQDERVQRPQRTGRAQQHAGEELRRHLFACTTPAASAPTPAAPTPSRLDHGSGPSYALVVGNERDSGTLAGGRAPPRGAAAVLTATGAPASTAGVPRSAATRQQGPELLIDGANVAFGGSSTFSAEGLRRAVDYFCTRTVGRRLPRGAVAVLLNENRWDPDDSALRALEAEGHLCWTPTAKYDDLFLLQYAGDHERAWVITNDRWKEERARRHATESIRRRVIRYAFLQGAFTPAADDLARFDHAGPRDY